MPGSQIKYAALRDEERLFQGEILSDLVQTRMSLDSVILAADTALKIVQITHPVAVVLTQDCDLEQDFKLRSEGAESSSKLANILMCETFTTIELKGKVPPGKDIWKRIIQNKDERYQCLEEIPPHLDAQGTGLGSLGCDFKRYFSVPADEIYERIKLKLIRRRARMISPYVEHLLSRFCYYQARVPLPENHFIAI